MSSFERFSKTFLGGPGLAGENFPHSHVYLAVHAPAVSALVSACLFSYGL